MALAKLLKDSILLAKAIGVTVLGVTKNESCLIQDSNLVCFIQFPSLVSANDRFVYKRAVAGEIFQYGDRITVLVLAKDQAVTIRNRR